MYRREKIKGYERYEVDTNGVVYSQTLWRVLNHYKASRSYRSCLWFYEDECPYNIGDSVNIFDNYEPDRGIRKLSDEDIIWIRKNYIPRDREFGTRGMAKKFNINHSTISDIINYKTYAEIC